MNNKNKIGELNKNQHGTEMKIIDYINCDDIIVEFQDEYKYKSHSKYKQFKSGRIKNPYDKSLFGVGYFGVGKYKATINKKVTKQYQTWSSMLQRCYYKKYHDIRPTYINCEVCNEWLNYQVFAKWYDENFYTIPFERICLDKDILHKHNKIYSSDNCIFVPTRINTLFIKNNAHRGGLPIGVHSHKGSTTYEALCSDGYCNQKHLGSFVTQREALESYKEEKKFIIIKTVMEYKDKIPKNTYDKLYNAVLNYEVEDDDD
jgi:hypothetical protein